MRLLPRRRLPAFLIAAASALGVIGISAAPARAYSIECRSSSISCISFSGYAGRSTWGFPVNSTGNNCVNYAAYRLARNGVAKPRLNLGNGGDWGNRARSMGYRVDSRPAVGAIAWWRYGSHFAPSNGHVAYVEEVVGSKITISDSSWSGGSKRYQLTAGEANWPNGFIHFRDVAFQPPPSGSFIRTRENGYNYRLVGRAPVRVLSWASYGGPKPVVTISDASLRTLPTRIAEGTFIRGNTRGEVYRVVGGAPIRVGSWATFGGPRPTITIEQSVIDRAGSGSIPLSKYSTTSYVSAKDTNGRYAFFKLQNGVAYRFTSWAQVGGVKPLSFIDWQAITHAGQPGGWSHIAAWRWL